MAIFNIDCWYALLSRYDAAASSGHAAAIANLGALFDDGRGVNEGVPAISTSRMMHVVW
jgi:hypothetical protein